MDVRQKSKPSEKDKDEPVGYVGLEVKEKMYLMIRRVVNVAELLCASKIDGTPSSSIFLSLVF